MDLFVNTSTSSPTFSHPAGRHCRSGLISIALTVIGGCVLWLSVSLEDHVEPQSPLPADLPHPLFPSLFTAYPHPHALCALFSCLLSVPPSPTPTHSTS